MQLVVDICVDARIALAPGSSRRGTCQSALCTRAIQRPFLLDIKNTEGHFLLDDLGHCAGSNTGVLAQEVCKDEWVDSAGL